MLSVLGGKVLEEFDIDIGVVLTDIDVTKNVILTRLGHIDMSGSIIILRIWLVNWLVDWFGGWLWFLANKQFGDAKRGIVTSIVTGIGCHVSLELLPVHTWNEERVDYLDWRLGVLLRSRLWLGMSFGGGVIIRVGHIDIWSVTFAVTFSSRSNMDIDTTLCDVDITEDHVLKTLEESDLNAGSISRDTDITGVDLLAFAFTFAAFAAFAGAGGSFS